MTDTLDRIKPLIVSLRRGIDPDENWAAFREIIEFETAKVCRDLSTRWLVSVCDTYADFGTMVEQRNAMFVSMLANLEKVAQTFLCWRVNYQDPFTVPEGHEPQRIKLWDGMVSMDFEVGDVTNNLFRRLGGLLSQTPHLESIFNEVLRRLEENDTVLAALNARHHHVFEPDLHWRDDPQYDHWREVGRLPPLKKTANR